MSARRPEEQRGLEAAERYAEIRAELEARRGDPPQPGDVFVIAGADAPVEWVLLRRDAQDPGRVFVVPADVSPLAGSADVAIPQGAAGGPLTLRCGLGRWLDVGHFEPANRTGAVDGVHLEEALRRWRDLQEGRRAESGPVREVDRDPEYQDWVAEVRRQVEALPSLDVARRKVTRGPAPSWWAGPGFRIAAAILLATTAVLGLALRRATRDAEALRHEYQSLEGRQRQQQEAWERERRQLEDEYARRAETRTDGTSRREGVAQSGGAILNVPFVWLSPRGPVRGQPERLALTPDARLVMLILEVEEPERYGSYRLEITSEGAGVVVFRADGLRPTATAELAVGLPGSVLASGGYRLRLLGLRDGRAEPVHEYTLRVVGAKAPSASPR